MPAKKLKILIVEDNEDERQFMKEGFSATGLYEVVGEAENGDELLNIFSKPSITLPDLVLTDLNMPGSDGYEVIREVKASEALSRTHVVVLSTAPFVPYAQRCKQLGACAYYTKPDSFLEYEGFAKVIYPQLLEKCLHQ